MTSFDPAEYNQLGLPQKVQLLYHEAVSLGVIHNYDNQLLHSVSVEEQKYATAEAKKEQKRRAKPRDGTQLFCGVCGDKAMGYNFDAVTCESCKAFFRRNAMKAKNFTCSFDGNCKLDAHTRRFCPGCRLKKCFGIGMRKDWILSSAQLAKRRSRLQMRSASISSSMAVDEYPSSSRDAGGSLDSSSDVPEAQFSAQAESSEALQDEEQVEEGDYMVPIPDDIQEELNVIHLKYNDIFEATYSIEQCTRMRENPTTSCDLFNMTDIFIRRLIKFSKCIPEFKSLKQEDQIHLLKGGIMEMFVLRSAMGFDIQKGSWKFQAQQQEGGVKEGSLDSNSLKTTLGSNMFSNHIEFVKSIHQLTKGNRIILILLFIIQLMSSDRPKLENKLLVSQGREKFSMWLKVYLESLYTVREAKILYPKLLMKLLDVQQLGEASSKLAASLDISRLEPLLVEIFDLK